MRALITNNVTLHVADSGPQDAPAVLFANSLGTDLRVWDLLLPLLPKDFRYVRYDKRGHGLSSCPDAPWSIDDLAMDAAAIIEEMQLAPVIFVGLSIGGMIGQKLASSRPDLIRALVLSNTATRMGEPEMWRARISAIESNGLDSVESAILDRWFGPEFRKHTSAELWGAMLSRTPARGYINSCKAIAGTNLSETTAAIRLPTLAIAGSHDAASPAELVKETADLIAASEFKIIPNAGHLPCVEAPADYAAVLAPFLKRYAYDKQI